MTKILFVCHGNICRSPTAEFIMKDLVRKAELSDIHIESAATSTEELGNPVYPESQKLLLVHGIDPAGKTARQMTRRDYGDFDYIIGMDENNIKNMKSICGGDPEGKFALLMSYAGEQRSVADPWYTRDFEKTWRDIMRGCEALLRKIAPQTD